MITIETKVTDASNVLDAAVFGEFTLADYGNFEEAILQALQTTGDRVDLILDLRDMTGFTVDVAWEEIRFSRSHARDFGRIAVITTSLWVSWSAWISRLFVDAAFQVFDDYEQAEAWIHNAPFAV